MTALLLDVILYRLAELYQHCRGSSCLDHQGPSHVHLRRWQSS